MVVTGDAAEHDLAARVVRAAGLPATANLAGTTLLGLAGVIAGARLVICGDTGVGHLASEYGTPSVLLFGPVSPASWGPPVLPEHVVLWHGDGSGDPHGTAPDPALLAIGTDEVLAAAQRLLGSGRGTTPDRVQHALGDQWPQCRDQLRSTADGVPGAGAGRGERPVDRLGDRRRGRPVLGG